MSTALADTATKANIFAPTENFELTAKDTCDACGARAYYKVTVKVELSDLLFCNHHYRKHSAKLVQDSARILDESAAFSK